VGLQDIQIGRLVQVTTFAQIVVGVNKWGDLAHFASIGNLEEVFVLLHQPLLQFPNSLVEKVTVLDLRLLADLNL
jgi:hypothetical protein